MSISQSDDGARDGGRDTAQPPLSPFSHVLQQPGAGQGAWECAPARLRVVRNLVVI